MKLLLVRRDITLSHPLFDHFLQYNSLWDNQVMVFEIFQIVYNNYLISLFNFSPQGDLGIQVRFHS